MTSKAPYAETPPHGAALRRIDAAPGRIAIWDRPGEKGRAPLLLIHGNSASKAAFGALFESPALRPWRLVAMDLPGSGESEDASDPPGDYTIPAMARTVAEVARAMGLDRPLVLGWSLGGHIAIEAVGQGMDVRGLVLTGTPPCGPGPEEVAATFVMDTLGDVAFSENPGREQLDAYVRRLYGDSRDIPDAFFAAARRCDGRMRRLFAEHWLSGADGFHQRSVIAAPQPPIAVIQGDREPFYDPALVDFLTWGDLWRGASQTVRGAGHAPFFEDPAAYAHLLAAFAMETEDQRTAKSHP